ncbi:transmembrane protein 45B-like [Asterias amurensis]|uniref:transmembrane protein 45B-like n=1 Tax=Asterias amurensis TaxID=7602 RepID=UPI003AB27630
MGTFAGHALPGAFFMVFAVWWMVQFAYQRVALDHGRVKPRGRLFRALHRLPIEGVAVLLAGIIGFIAENFYPYPKWIIYDDDGKFANTHVWQHCAMYSFFSLYGIVVIFSKTCMPHAEKYTKLLGAVAFFVEGMLFHFHTVGRPAIDVHLHNLLVLAISACMLFTLGEAFFPKEERFRIMRCTAALLQGTWFFQVGSVLYWPPSGKQWDDEDHSNLMFLTEAFVWHLLVDVCLIVLVYGISFLILKATGHSTLHYREMKTVDGRDNIEFGTTSLLDNGEPNAHGYDSE